MVDLKHRYGSNLRTYHAEWKKADTHENFFYWLDHGKGRDIELPMCNRERLEREQVRYLSREERMQYLVDVDSEGRLRWRKNGQRIDTTEEYRDSMVGIVPKSDEAKTFRQDELEALQESNHPRAGQAQLPNDSDSEDDAISSDGEGEKRYPDPAALKEASGPRKIAHVTPATILNRLMRKSVKKNTWIFVADTAGNLYVGIKQSGSFQHSSFLHGSRISSAGLIKVKHGQLRSLSPLSGHYRPPTSAFKHFIGSLKERDVDMSRVSISKSYAVLVGLEAYMGSKKKVQHGVEEVKKGAGWVVHPDKERKRREMESDKSASAKLEDEKMREKREQDGGVKQLLKGKRHEVGDKWADVERKRVGDGMHTDGNGRIFQQEDEGEARVRTGAEGQRI